MLPKLIFVIVFFKKPAACMQPAGAEKALRKM
jgi:hypothetical protein